MIGQVQFNFETAPGERPIKLWCDCGRLGTQEDPALITGIMSLRIFVPRHADDCEPHVEFKP